MIGGSPEIQGTEVSVRARERFEFDLYELTKTVADRVLALVLLVISSPVIVCSMFLVRLTSSGAPIYTQRRVGHNGRIFTIYKIRSMYVDSEVHGPRWSLPGDKRVTPIGRFLRWSHLDELPQLINVIRGEMSLIGPRPERPELIAQLERVLPNYHLRHRIRPGLSGLAQVLQAPDTDLESVSRKLKYDLYYVDRLSFSLDARIAIATAALFLGLSGATIAQVFSFPFEEYEPEPTVKS